MALGEVTSILAEFDAVGCQVWVAGGWGVDALLGHQTRPHRDLDLAIDAEDRRAVLATLEGRGYEVETDWRPVRVELTRAGVGRVDLHPVVFDEGGDGRQAGLDGGHFDYPRAAFVLGRLDGVRVPCLSVPQQVAFHHGYAPRAVDLHDLELLAALDRPQVHDSERADLPYPPEPPVGSRVGRTGTEENRMLEQDSGDRDQPSTAQPQAGSDHGCP